MDNDEKIAALEKRIDSCERAIRALILRVETARFDTLFDIYNASHETLSKGMRRTERSRAQQYKDLEEWFRSAKALEK